MKTKKTITHKRKPRTPREWAKVDPSNTPGKPYVYDPDAEVNTTNIPMDRPETEYEKKEREKPI